LWAVRPEGGCDVGDDCLDAARSVVELIDEGVAVGRAPPELIAAALLVAMGETVKRRFQMRISGLLVKIQELEDPIWQPLPRQKRKFAIVISGARHISNLKFLF
jgi:hypothetical protein